MVFFSLKLQSKSIFELLLCRRHSLLLHPKWEYLWRSLLLLDSLVFVIIISFSDSCYTFSRALPYDWWVNFNEYQNRSIKKNPVQYAWFNPPCVHHFPFNRPTALKLLFLLIFFGFRKILRRNISKERFPDLNIKRFVFGKNLLKPANIRGSASCQISQLHEICRLAQELGFTIGLARPK